MVLGCGAVFTLIGMAGWNLPLFKGPAAGAAFTVANAVPGVLFLGVLFCVPTALILVVTMARLMRWRAVFGNMWLWGLAGAVTAAPIAALFGAMFAEKLFNVPSIHTTLLALGFVCGLAGRWGYRLIPDQPLPENPATTAS